jgi:hypothetical protein
VLVSDGGRLDREAACLGKLRLFAASLNGKLGLLRTLGGCCNIDKWDGGCRRSSWLSQWLVVKGHVDCELRCSWLVGAAPFQLVAHRCKLKRRLRGSGPTAAQVLAGAARAIGD